MNIVDGFSPGGSSLSPRGPLPQGSPASQGIFGIVERWERESPDRPAVTYEGQTRAWADFVARARRNAGAQVAAGLAPGDRVAFYDKNHPACLETTFGCALAGTVNVPVNFRLAPAEVAYILNDSRSRVVFAGAEMLGALKEIEGDLETLERVVVVDERSGLGFGGADEYETWLGSAEPLTAPVTDAPPDDCVLQLYTSGTTGFPKGAMLTHAGISHHTDLGLDLFGYTADSVAHVVMPLFHVGGTNLALYVLRSGGRLVLGRDADPVRILDDFERERVTHSFMVPAIFQTLLDVGDIDRRDMTSLRLLGYGGCPMPPPLLRACLEAFPQAGFAQIYGMTEMSGVVAVLDAEDHLDPANPRLTSAGKAVPGAEMKVVDPATGAEVPRGTVGEFWVRSAQRMAGYWGRPEASADTITPDGWLRSGDAGVMDGGGFVYLSDRVKDMLISGGENVYPAEVERVACEHPAVAEVAVIGVPDERWGEVPKAIVVPKAGMELSPGDLIAFCQERLARYKCPKSVAVVEALPRTASGKVLKRQLREEHA